MTDIAAHWRLYEYITGDRPDYESMETEEMTGKTVTKLRQIDEGGYVHPIKGEFGYSSGISMRDYFAGQALSGLASKGGLCAEDIAECAYMMADAMLEAKYNHD